MAARSEQLDVVLQAVVLAYREGEGGKRRELIHVATFGPDAAVLHDAWPSDGPEISRADLEELSDQGLLRIREQQKSWAFAPTNKGEERADELARARLRPQFAGFDATWGAMRPVLRATVEAWEEGGAPDEGADTFAIAQRLELEYTDPALGRSLELLAEDKWVELVWEGGSPIPLAAKPLTKALQALRAWPGQPDADALAERLLTAIDQTMEATKDQQERGRLQKLRDFAIDLGANTTAEIAAKMAAGQV